MSIKDLQDAAQTPNDLDAIVAEWLQQCGPCDAGLPMGCACSDKDYRQPMSALVGEVERLRATVARVESTLGDWGMDDDEDGFAEAIRESGAWRLARDLNKALGRAS